LNDNAETAGAVDGGKNVPFKWEKFCRKGVGYGDVFLCEGVVVV